MILFPSRCYNGGQRHRFEPRYSASGAGPWSYSQTQAVFFADTDEGKAQIARAMSSARQYHGDVCVWCGKVTNPQPAKATP